MYIVCEITHLRSFSVLKWLPALSSMWPVSFWGLHLSLFIERELQKGSEQLLRLTETTLNNLGRDAVVLAKSLQTWLWTEQGNSVAAFEDPLELVSEFNTLTQRLISGRVYKIYILLSSPHFSYLERVSAMCFQNASPLCRNQTPHCFGLV